jgi:putative flippase GtrA
VGGIATVIDWGAFYALAIILGVYYQFALVCGFVLGSITHYTLNKKFTFKCKSTEIVKQFSLFFAIAIMSLLLSIFIMYVFVEVIQINQMLSRMITTGIMVSVNYLSHKNLTFNKKIFNPDKNDLSRLDTWNLQKA